MRSLARWRWSGTVTFQRLGDKGTTGALVSLLDEAGEEEGENGKGEKKTLLL